MIKIYIQDIVNKRNALTGPICKKIFSSVWKKEAEITVRITTAEESQALLQVKAVFSQLADLIATYTIYAHNKSMMHCIQASQQCLGAEQAQRMAR